MFNTATTFTSRVLSFLLIALWATGCAVSPYSSDSKKASESLLSKQIQEARSKVQASEAPRVLFAGFAMNSESKAFQADVRTGTQFVKQLDPQAVIFQLAIPAVGESSSLPYATRENIQAVIAAIGQLARPQDKVVLLFSTDGAPDILSIHADKPSPAVRSGDLRLQTADTLLP